MQEFKEKLERNVIDNREPWKVWHKLVDIIMIVLWSSMSDCDKWEDVEDFGKEYEEVFREFLELPHGIPSHDTMQRAMSVLDGEYINRLFVVWLQEKLKERGCKLKSELEREITAIDGKTACGSKNEYHKAVHIVSAYCVNNCLSLAQIKTDEKSNEITAIPKLLDMLQIEGQIVTIDAMGCQKDIAKKIKEEKKADYILSLKGNQETFEQETAEYFSDKMLLAETQAIDGSYYIHKEKSHSSIITYEATVTDDLSWFEDKDLWLGLNIIGMIEKTTVSIKSGEKTKETRYYIGSIERNAKLLYEATRAHWCIETSLHWHLDVTFREDANQTKDIRTVQNMNIFNKISLTMLKMADFGKKRLSIARKRKLLHLNFPKYLKMLILSLSS